MGFWVLYWNYEPRPFWLLGEILEFVMGGIEIVGMGLLIVLVVPFGLAAAFAFVNLVQFVFFWVIMGLVFSVQISGKIVGGLLAFVVGLVTLKGFQSFFGVRNQKIEKLPKRAESE